MYDAIALWAALNLAIEPSEVMFMLSVFVVLPPGQPSPSTETAALLDGCRATAGGRACTISAEDGSAPSDLLVSLRFHDSDQRIAELRLRYGTRERPILQTRWVEFRTSDDSIERWRAIGLIIGTSASAKDERPQVERNLQAPPGGESRSAEGRPATPAWRWSVDGGLIAGPGIDASSMSAGPFVRGSVAPWPIRLGITTSYGHQIELGASDFELVFGSGSFGAFAGVDVGPIGMELRGEAVERLVFLSASDQTTGGTDTHYRWLTGFRAGLDIDFTISNRLSLVAGFDATIFSQATPIRVRNVFKGDLPGLSFDVRIGLRLAFGEKSEANTSLTAEGMGSRGGVKPLR